MFWAQSTSMDYIRAEGDFHTETYGWKDQQGRDKTGRIEWENGRVVGRIHGMKYSWKGHKTEIDTRTEYIKRSGQARLIYEFDINCNIPTTWRWARGDPPVRKGILVPESTFSADSLTGVRTISVCSYMHWHLPVRTLKIPSLDSQTVVWRQENTAHTRSTPEDGI